MNPTATQADALDRERLIPTKAVRDLLGGISDMTLWRWQKDTTLAFPRPATIRKRKFFKLGEVLDFRDRQLAAHAGDPAP